MQTQRVTYSDGAVLCKGFVAFNEKVVQPQPTILIVHAFDGVTDFIRRYAEQVVDAGYVAFCVDMFGEGQIGTDLDGCMALIAPFLKDRSLLQQRIVAGFEACKAQVMVDAARIAAMGFCFGGTTVLDLARVGADVKGVACLHGSLLAPENAPVSDMTAKVLVLNGYDDPLVGDDQLSLLANELNSKNVDWQFVYFSHTRHSYTDPRAADIGGAKIGRVYNADSARRAWNYCQLFFHDVLK